MVVVVAVVLVFAVVLVSVFVLVVAAQLHRSLLLEVSGEEFVVSLVTPSSRMMLLKR